MFGAGALSLVDLAAVGTGEKNTEMDVRGMCASTCVCVCSGVRKICQENPGQVGVDRRRRLAVRAPVCSPLPPFLYLHSVFALAFERLSSHF